MSVPIMMLLFSASASRVIAVSLSAAVEMILAISGSYDGLTLSPLSMPLSMRIPAVSASASLWIIPGAGLKFSSAVSA